MVTQQSSYYKVYHFIALLTWGVGDITIFTLEMEKLGLMRNLSKVPSPWGRKAKTKAAVTPSLVLYSMMALKTYSA